MLLWLVLSNIITITIIIIVMIILTTITAVVILMIVTDLSAKGLEESSSVEASADAGATGGRSHSNKPETRDPKPIFPEP